ASCTLLLDGIQYGQNVSVWNNTATNITSSEIPDGRYSWLINCTDLAGNSGISGIREITVDTQGPAVALISPPDDISTFNASLNLSWLPTDHLSGYLDCYVTVQQPGSAPSTSGPYATANNTLGSQVNITTIEGIWFWNVTCGDIAGNNASSETRAFTIDTTAPVVVSTDPVDGYNSSDNTTDFGFYAYNHQSMAFNCSLYVDGSVYGANTSVLNNTPTNITSAEMTDGNHEWYINCSDLAGNWNVSETRYITVDTQDPIVVLNTPYNMTYSSATSQNLNWTAFDNSDTMLNCLPIPIRPIGSGPLLPWVDSPNSTATNYSINTNDQGLWHWNVNCTDNANNYGLSETWYFVVDRTAPVVANIAPPDSTYTNDNTTTFTFNYTDALSPNASCALYANDTTTTYNLGSDAAVLNNTNTGITSTELADNVYDWWVNCTDLAGNTDTSAPWTITIDTVNPGVWFNNPADGENWVVTNRTINVTANDTLAGVASVVFNITNSSNGAFVTQIAAAQDGDYWSATFDPNLYPDSNYTVTAAAADRAGNVNDTEKRWFIINTDPPVVDILYPANDSYVPEYFAITGNASEGGTGITWIMLEIEGINHTADFNPVTLGWELEYQMTGADSSVRTIDSVYINDTYGIIHRQVMNWRMTKDVYKPNAVITSPLGGSTLMGMVDVNFTAYDENGIEDCYITIDGKPYILITNKIWENSTHLIGAYNWNSSLETDGSHSLQVMCEDAALNEILSNQVLVYTENVDDTPLATPQLKWPENNHWHNSTNITLGWYDVTGEDQYQVEVTNLSGGGGIVPLCGENVTSSSVKYLSDGNYSWRVMASRNIGGGAITSEWSEIRVFWIDTTRPNVYPATYSEKNSLSFMYTIIANDTLDSELECRYSLSDVQFSSMADQLSLINASSGAYASTIGVPSDGLYTIYYGCRDEASNLNYSSSSVLVDSSAPSVVEMGTDLGTENLYNTLPSMLYAVTDENASCRYSTGGTLNYSLMTAMNDNNTYHNASITPMTGTNLYYIKCNDTSGHLMNDPVMYLFTMDNIPPHITNMAVYPTVGNWSEVNVNILTDENTYCQYSNDTFTYGSGTNTTDNSYGYKHLISLTSNPGLNRIFLLCADGAGNVVDEDETRAYYYDVWPPNATVNPLDNITNSLQFNVSWAVDEDWGMGSYDIWVYNGSWYLWMDDTPLTSAVFLGVEGQSYGFEAVATDTSGNEETRNIVEEANTTIDTTYGLVLLGLQATKANAVADGSDYWEYRFQISLNNGNTRARMRLDDWSSNGYTIPVAGYATMIYTNSSGQQRVYDISNDYQDLQVVDSLFDEDSNLTNGIQTTLTLRQILPLGTHAGTYTTDYGIQDYP
ncbi:hypothetical protein JW968_04840, partial [Candidatus Woesearchaeota archaeon]|nr:hypothetical protein [Candidatus Woesearchaeota archaeon]